MARESEFVAFLLEQLEPLGAVRAKSMFGGYGLYLDTLMFGLVASDTLYLKVDDTNRPAFEAEGLGPFTFTRGDKTFAMSYFEAPADALDSRDDLCRWAGEAHAAACRAAERKPPRKRRRKKT